MVTSPNLSLLVHILNSTWNVSEMLHRRGTTHTASRLLTCGKYGRTRVSPLAFNHARTPIVAQIARAWTDRRSFLFIREFGSLPISSPRAIRLCDGGVFPFVWFHCEQAGTTSARLDTGFSSSVLWTTCRIFVWQPHKLE
jgi:hypothetical protein